MEQENSNEALQTQAEGAPNTHSWASTVSMKNNSNDCQNIDGMQVETSSQKEPANSARNQFTFNNHASTFNLPQPQMPSNAMQNSAVGTRTNMTFNNGPSTFTVSQTQRMP